MPSGTNDEVDVAASRYEEALELSKKWQSGLEEHHMLTTLTTLIRRMLAGDRDAVNEIRESEEYSTANFLRAWCLVAINQDNLFEASSDKASAS